MRLNESQLKIACALKGLTVERLAELSGISHGTISSVRNGKSCSYNTAVKIAEALEIDINEIIKEV